MSDAHPGLPDRVMFLLQKEGLKALDGDDELWQQLCDAYADTVGEWAEIRAILKKFSVCAAVEQRVKSMLHKKRNVRQIRAPVARNSVLSVWGDAPVSAESFAPDEYALLAGVPALERVMVKTIAGQQVETRLAVSNDPIVVTRRLGHMQSSEILLEVAWRGTHGRWHRQVFDRDVFMSNRKIVDTSLRGLPVSSVNAPELVRWIQQYERQNQTVLPVGYVTHSMGWQGGADDHTKHGFLCGTRQLGGNGRAIELHGSEGDMADAEELREHGRASSWTTAIGRMAHFPAVRLAIYAALAAPFIAPLEGPNAIVEWAGRTSTGKSTLLRIAQSCWKSANVSLPTWNTTMIGIEAQASAGSDLPLFVDDTAAAVDGGRSQNLGKVIYQLVSGRARGRGAIKGGQRLRSSWRTLVLSTGETPLSELAKAEGAAARVLTFWSAPLGPTSTATAQTSSEVMAELGEHFGHAGPAVVRWLCEHREQWKTLRELAAETARRVRIAIRTPAASRLSEVVGLLEATAFVAHQACGLPWQPQSLLDDKQIVDAITGAVELSSATADRAYLAWEHAIGVAQSRPHSWLWWGTRPGSSGVPEEHERRDPPGGWLGYRSVFTDISLPPRWAWYPHQLRKVLEDGGFNVEGTLRAWKDIDLLVNPDHARFTSVIRPAGDRSQMRMIVVKDEYPGDLTSEQ